MTTMTLSGNVTNTGRNYRNQYGRWVGLWEIKSNPIGNSKFSQTNFTTQLFFA